MGYSFAQLEQLWVQAGGSSATAPIAAAVALAESGGNPSSISPSGDYGLWQINSSNFGEYALDSQTALNPLANARTAIAMSGNGANWACWCSAWANPQNCGCGKGHLAAPQVGSAASRYIQPGTVLTPVVQPQGVPGVTYTPCSARGDSGCAWKLSLGLLGNPCMVTYCQLKAIRAAACIGAGGLVMGFGVIVLVAALGSTGAGRVVTRVASKSGPLGFAIKGTQRRRAERRVTAEQTQRREERQTNAEAAAARKRYASSDRFAEGQERGRRAAQEAGPFTEADRTRPARPGDTARRRQRQSDERRRAAQAARRRERVG